MADSQPIVLSRVQAIKMVSWDSATVILNSLWGWYSKISNPKKKSEYATLWICFSFRFVLYFIFFVFNFFLLPGFSNFCLSFL
jgi:hypothetical protein